MTIQDPPTHCLLGADVLRRLESICFLLEQWRSAFELKAGVRVNCAKVACFGNVKSKIAIECGVVNKFRNLLFKDLNRSMDWKNCRTRFSSRFSRCSILDVCKCSRSSIRLWRARRTICGSASCFKVIRHIIKLPSGHGKNCTLRREDSRKKNWRRARFPSRRGIEKVWRTFAKSNSSTSNHCRRRPSQEWRKDERTFTYFHYFRL